MIPSDDQSEEDAKHLDELCDRLLQAGLATQHGHTKALTAITFTPRGQAIVRAFKELDSALGDTTAADRAGLWDLFVLWEAPGHAQ